MKLTSHMRACLRSAARGPLYRQRDGWTITGLASYPPATVEALERRGLLTINRLAGCAGEARITKAGRAALEEGEISR